MKRKKFNIDKNKTGRVILIFVMLIAFSISLWLLISPSIEKKKVLEKQYALIAKIESDTKPYFSMPKSVTTSEPKLNTEQEIFGEINFEEVIFEEVPIGYELGILSIEKLNMKLPVVEGVTEELLDIAVGHVPQTATVGNIGNAVIAGHRMYKYGQFFNRLGEVEYGDIVTFISTNGTEMNFVVDEILEVEINDQNVFNQPKDVRQITLYTCTPIGTATHRLLIRASLV